MHKAEGGWTDVCYPSDLITVDKSGLWLVAAGCCAYSGIRALDACRQGVASRRGDVIEVNIPWTCSTPWATSRLRERGGARRFELAVQDASSVRIRNPGWLDGPPKVTVKASDASIRKGSVHLSFIGLRKGDRIEILMTARERETREQAGADNSGRETADPRLRGSCQVRWLGERVCRMEIRGKYLPLFPE